MSKSLRANVRHVCIWQYIYIKGYILHAQGHIELNRDVNVLNLNI